MLELMKEFFNIGYSYLTLDFNCFGFVFNMLDLIIASMVVTFVITVFRMILDR